jgi:hypothetical protein
MVVGRGGTTCEETLSALPALTRSGTEHLLFGKREFKAGCEKESVGILRKEKGEVREKVNLLESWGKETKETPHLKNRAPIGTEEMGFASTGRIADSRTMDLRVEVKRRRLKLFSWPLRKGRKHVKSWPLLLQVTSKIHCLQLLPPKMIKMRMIAFINSSVVFLP